ncbi:hypothetical protein R1flu_008534 [Riccia fluitans]|uniref:Uncharacterized protein n=1 Tax=Riccia fluitans TaxID=41844 RepID=A0ABD1YFJ4_9MARC
MEGKQRQGVKWINSFYTSHLPISFNSLDPQAIQFRATLCQEASWSEAVIQEERSAFNRGTQSSNTQAPENTLITSREFISSAVEGIDYQLSPHGEVNIQSENELIVNKNTRVGSISDLPLYNSSRSDNFTTGNRHLSSVDEDGTHSRFQDEDTNEAITHLSDENSLADSPPYCTVNVASCDDPEFPVDFSTLGNEMHIRTDRPSPNTDHVRRGSALSAFLSREEQIEQSSFASPRGQDSHTDGRVYGREIEEGSFAILINFRSVREGVYLGEPAVLRLGTQEGVIRTVPYVTGLPSAVPPCQIRISKTYRAISTRYLTVDSPGPR